MMIGRIRHPRGAGPWRLFSAFLLVLLLAGGAAATVSILPLGDSITHGGTGDGGVLYPTYRYWLYQDIRMLGYDIDFVGSLHAPEAPAGSDPENEGHSAYTAGQVGEELPAWLQAYPPPQVSLIHLGTNDVLSGIPASETVAHLAAIVGELRARNPSMVILVAQIIPTSVETMNERIEVLNREITGLGSLSTEQSPIVIVDQYSGFDMDADLQEGGAHPTTTGEKKMAARWLEALLPVLARGVPGASATVPATTVATSAPAAVTIVPTVVPTPSPAVTTTSRFGPRVYRINGGDTTTRSGTVSGRTTSRASQSRVTASGAGTSISPPALSFRRWYPATRWSAGIR